MAAPDNPPFSSPSPDLPPPDPGSPSPPSPLPFTRADAVALAAIVALALALRLWRLGEVPPGLHVDEAHNGVDALAILRGARPIYLAGNNGREALLSYLQAVTVGLFGPTPAALRLASAVAGTAAVAVAYGLARALPSPWPRRLAAATAVLMAVSVWPLHFSRIAIRGILMPLLGGAFAWALWRALGDGGGGAGRRAWRRYALAGALLGAALYAHPAARLMPLVPVVLLGGRAALAGRRRDGAAARRALAGLATLAATAIVVAAPLLTFAVTHRDLVLGHSVGVSVLEADNRAGGLARRLALNAWRTLRAFVWDGSDSWYHNVAGRPVFDGVTAVMTVVGAAAIVRACRGAPGPQRDATRSAASFGLAWLFALALPVVLTGGAPNYSRSVGLMPMAFVLPAVGYAAAAGWAAARLGAARLGGARRRGDGASRAGPGTGPPMRPRPIRPAVLLALLLAPALGATVRDYFGRYAAAPEAAAAFGAPTVAKAAALRALAAGAGGRVQPTRLVAERSVYRFLLDGAALTPIDPARGFVLPADGPAWLAFDADAEGDALQALLDRWPRLRLAEARLAAPGWRVLRVDAPPDEPGNPVTPAAAFDGLTLESVAGGPACDAVPREPDLLCAAADGTLDLALRWRVVAAPGRDWTAFAHLVAADGRTEAQHDGAPLAGWLPTSRWRVGDAVIDRFVVRLPAGAPGRRLALRVGWYDGATGERLGLAGDGDGAAEVATVAAP